MSHTIQALIGGAIISLMGSGAIVSVIPSAASKPPIELTDLRWNGEAVEFTRVVNVDETVRATVVNEMIDVETERTVHGCLLTPPRRADFDPHETETKVFTLERFISSFCPENPVKGRKYVLLSVVAPLDGREPTSFRSEPFVWNGN